MTSAMRSVPNPLSPCGRGRLGHGPSRVRGGAQRILTAALLAAAAATGAGAEETAAFHYLLHCSGCHTPEGTGSNLGGVPPFRDIVGHFLQSSEGRRYLANVPGLVNSGLAPAEAADLLNWIIATFGGASRPERAVPLDGAEVERLRRSPPDDIVALRHKLRKAFAVKGIDIGAYPE
jgi:hypothetical protein